MATVTAPTHADIEAARERLRGVAQLTPIHYSETFSRRAGRRVLLKAENLQRTGAFKIRGAANKIAGLTEAERAAGATFVPPFEDELVIAGQGTIGLELAEQLPEIETVIVPVGGGGLAAGIAIALRERRPDIRVVGVQAEVCAPLAGR